MSEIERIQAAAAHPENWKPVKPARHPSGRRPSPVRSLLTSWSGVWPLQPLPRESAARAETEENSHGK